MDEFTREDVASSFIPDLAGTEKKQLQAFFYLYKSFYEEFWRYAKSRMGELTALKLLTGNRTECTSEEYCAWTLALVEDAVFKDQWKPYLEYLALLGQTYAGRDLDFHFWYEIAKLIRDFYTPKLIENDIERQDVVISALNGMEHFIHISMRAVEEAYLSEKQIIIESQKRDQDRLNKDAQLLVYNVSHDLKQPLTTVKGLISLLGEQYPQLLKGESGTYMEHISKSTEWMEQLITGLLDYSKIGQTRQPEEVDLNVLVEDTLFEMYPWIKSLNAKIEVERLPTLTVYPIEVKLLFQNLIGNALKYRKEGRAPEIRIRSELKGNKWQLMVADNGIGIDPENKDEIFILFRRLHSSNQVSGTGIGLAHCKKIVELHNGEIGVESTPGKGSTFFFTMSDVEVASMSPKDMSSPITDIKSGEHKRLNKLKEAL